jgi:hypothetical protein
MTNTLDREIRLWVNPKDSGLYRWALQEFDDKGAQVGEDQVHWHWTNFFTATNLQLGYSLESEYKNREDLENFDKILVERELITAELHPGYISKGILRNAPEYSMLGTDRIISDFSLRIEKLRNNNLAEGVTVWGVPSHTDEINFRAVTRKDCIVVTIFLGTEKFARIADAIKLNAAESIDLTLGQIRGFYSAWTPSVIVDRIKVLTADKEQKVKIPDECDIRPHRLFDFQLEAPEQTDSSASFSLSIGKRVEIKFATDFEQRRLESILNGPSELDRKAEADRQKEEAQRQYSSLLISRIERNEEALNALRVPIWLIFLLLVFGFVIGVFR